MKRPAFWILLARRVARRRRRRLALLPSGLLHRRARHHDGPRARARRGAGDLARDGLGPAGLPPGRVVLRSTATRRRSSSSKAAARRPSRACCATASTRPTRGASAISRKEKPTRPTIRFTPGRPAVRVRRAAQGGRAGRRAGAADARAARRNRRGRALARRTSPRSRSSSRDRNGVPAAASITRSPTSGATPTLNEGRYRLRLVVVRRSPDRGHATSSRSRKRSRGATQNMRSANERSASGRRSAMVLLYVVGGIGVGLFFMLRQPLGAVAPGGDLGRRSSRCCRRSRRINELPLLWMAYDTALPRSTFIAQQVGDARGRRSSASRCSSRCRSWRRKR